MDFKTVIAITGKIYNFLEKMNIDESISLDGFIDNYYPQVLSRLQTYSKKGKIAICASNGAKTTLNFLNHILNEDNKSTIVNVSQDAKKYPLLTAIVLDLSRSMGAFNNIYEKDYYLMAFDEYELAPYFNSVKFDYLLLHNLFVDQRDFSTLIEKRKKIQDAIALNSKLNLIINADEPMFYKIDEIKNDTVLNKKRNKIFYGFNNVEFCEEGADLSQKNDIMRCPICSCKLDYTKRFYSHLGHYDCACGFKRPKLDISADVKIFANYSFLNVYHNDNKYVFKLPSGGLYNAYNALGAIALAIAFNIERKTITSAFEKYIPLRARDEIINYKNKQIKIKVIKNPVSLSEALRELYFAKRVKVVFCFNNDYQDGIDTSWIWDSNFDSLKGFENKIYITSNRFDDMALRLKYAGVNPCLMNMDSSIKSSVECCFWELEENESMLILTVPSLVDEVYKVFKK